MTYKPLLLALLLVGCQGGGENLVAAVSIKAGTGPHDGAIQEARGTKVELVPMSDGTLRAYVTDQAGVPLMAQGEVKATISAPSFAPQEIILRPEGDGAYFVGTLPASLPEEPADVNLFFPGAEVNLTYQDIPLSSKAAARPGPVQVVSSGVPPDFTPPHKGVVSRVGDNLVEVVIAPKGEVRTYVYDLTGAPVPLVEVKIPSVQVTYEGKPYTVKLKPNPKQGYLSGRVNTKVTIPKDATVEIAFVEPIIIHEVSYAPDVIVFPVYVVYEPIIIVPVVKPLIEIEIGHSHHHSHHKHKKFKKHKHWH